MRRRHESFAARFKPVAGEDADNFAYHTQMTKVMAAVRTKCVVVPKALLTGALGCSCAGYGGALGLLGGLLVFVLPAALRAQPAQ